MLYKYWQDYQEKVEQYAEKVFNDLVLPYCKKYHLTFLAGNGTCFLGYTDKTPKWFVYQHKGTYSTYYHGLLDYDTLPQWLQSILNESVEGMPSNSLGSLMPNYEEG